jgi:hypothetical protein
MLKRIFVAKTEVAGEWKIYMLLNFYSLSNIIREVNSRKKILARYGRDDK